MLIFASDKKNIPALDFKIQAKEKKAVIHSEQFSNFNRIVNSVTYVQRADLTDLEALTPNHFLLDNKNVCLPYLKCVELIVDFWKFPFDCLPAVNMLQKWSSTTINSFQDGNLVGLTEDSDGQGYYNLGWVKKTIEVPDKIFRATIFRTDERI